MTAANGCARLYPGLTASPGAAAGLLYQADTAAVDSPATAEQVHAAFAAVAADRAALAGRLRAEGRPDEAEIVAVAGLIAADPALADAAVAAVRAGTDAATAVQQAAARQAAALAALADPELADRATDVRQVAAAVLDHLAGGPQARPYGEFILVRRDVAASELIELADSGLVGAASVSGGASSHAAIIARGIGIPMITGLGEAALGEATGSPAIMDAAPAGSPLTRLRSAGKRCGQTCHPPTAQLPWLTWTLRAGASQPTAGTSSFCATRPRLPKPGAG